MKEKGETVVDMGPEVVQGPTAGKALEGGGGTMVETGRGHENQSQDGDAVLEKASYQNGEIHAPFRGDAAYEGSGENA